MDQRLQAKRRRMVRVQGQGAGALLRRGIERAVVVQAQRLGAQVFDDADLFALVDPSDASRGEFSRMVRIRCTSRRNS